MLYYNKTTRVILYDHIEKFIISKSIKYDMFIKLVKTATDNQLIKILSAIIPYYRHIPIVFNNIEYTPIDLITDIYKSHPNNSIVIDTIINMWDIIFDDYILEYQEYEIYNQLLNILSLCSHEKILQLLITYEFPHNEDYIYLYCLDSLCKNSTDFVINWISTNIELLMKTEEFNKKCWMNLSVNTNIKAIELMMIYLTDTDKDLLNKIYSKIRYDYNKLKQSKSQLHNELNNFFVNPHNIIKTIHDIM